MNDSSFFFFWLTSSYVEDSNKVTFSCMFCVLQHGSWVCMVLHTMQFMNSFPWKGGLKHCPPSAIMNGTRLHMNQLQLKFGSYCQVAEDVTPRNSLAARTRGAISLGPSGNLSGGQRFLTLDTGKLIVRNRCIQIQRKLLTGNLHTLSLSHTRTISLSHTVGGVSERILIIFLVSNPENHFRTKRYLILGS